MSERSSAPEASSASEAVDLFGSVPAEVLETMFFTEAVRAGCAHEWLPEAVSIEVGFRGSHIGLMRMRVSWSAAESVASAFLGIEQRELTEALVTGVSLEFGNILCGAILSRLWRESNVVLDPPKSSIDDSPATGLHRCFDLPEGKLAVWMDWAGRGRTIALDPGTQHG